MKETLILASHSPRRRELLERIGVSFEIVTDGVDESVSPDFSPDEIVCELAERKARPISDRHPGRLILAADTIVVLDGEVLGKPESAAEAVDMLSRLSGRTHEVYTGVALLHKSSGRRVVEYEVTAVTFSLLALEEIEAYVEGGSPLDKAGAYGIQDDRGALFINKVSGDYYTVVGLPLNLIYRLIRQYFADLTVF